MKYYLQYLKYKWEELDIRLFIVSLMYGSKDVESMERYDKHEEVNHGEVVSTKDLGDDKILSIYEDGCAIISGSNNSGQLGIDEEDQNRGDIS